MKLRIAHYIHRYPPALGGAEAYFARLSQFLCQQGDQIQVHTSNALALEAFWHTQAAKLPSGKAHVAGVQIHKHPIRTFAMRRYFMHALSYVVPTSLKSLCMPVNPIMPSMWDQASQLQKIDIVHASAFPYGWPLRCAVRLADRLKIPFVLTPFLHLGDIGNQSNRTRTAYLSPPLKWILGRADRILAQTQLERLAILETGIPEQRVLYQGLGVEPAECTGGQRSRADARWQLPVGVPRVGHLANLSDEKGSIDLIRAAQKLWHQGLALHCVLAGPSMPNFRRYWRSLEPKYRDRIALLGALPPEQKADFYAAIDLFALPSRSDSFGLVLLEAWVNQIPCIGYRAGGLAEVIQHEMDGLLVPCGDWQALALALQRLLQSEAERQRMGQRGNSKCRHHFQWLDKLQFVRNVYLELCSTDYSGFK